MPLLKAQHLIGFVPQAMQELQELIQLLLSPKIIWQTLIIHLSQVQVAINQVLLGNQLVQDHIIRGQ